MNMFIMEYDDKGEDMKMEDCSDVKERLEEVVDVDEMRLIGSGNGDMIEGAGEEWNDG
ncbi:arginine deiminase family protein, partial [Staphylococcus epidermidis]|uniref:arginine deiminase family protein n=1 Tax=Staphylococcus epidermidis TaxID=1282 RepID=UPI0028CBA6B9